MPTCPRCHQPVEAQAITCPYCRATLKAHGHPGIPLYRASGAEYLCQSCTYNEDDSCTYPQRPYARECTLYHDRSQPIQPQRYQPSLPYSLSLWVKRNAGWLVILGILAISVLIAARR